MDLLKRFTDYLNSPQNHLSKKTVKNYRADLNSFFRWYKKEYNLDLTLAPSMVTSQIVESYKKSKIQDSSLSSVSLNRHLSSLRKFFQFLKSEGTILEDQFEQISMSTEKLNSKPYPWPKSSNLNILNNIIWRLKGKPIFYSPLSTSARKNPLYKKIWHYFYLAVFILFVSQLGLVINQTIAPKPESQMLGVSTRLSPKPIPKEQLANPTLTVNATGSAKFTNDVNIGRDIITSGSGTFSKLNLSLIQPAIEVSQKELIATGSAGIAYVHSFESEVTIKNTLVTESSLIYITPAGTPSGQIPFLLRQVPDGTWLRQVPEGPAVPAPLKQMSEGGSETEGSFTVGIASASATTTPFNWLIIN